MKKNNTNTNRNQRNPREIQEIRKDRLGHVHGGGDPSPLPSPDAQRKE
jgi:hypothetical protein